MLQRLRDAWRRSDRLLGLLADEAWLEQPIPLRQPFVFYLGHLPAFAWNHLGRRALGAPAIDPGFEDLFERGIDPVGVDAYQPRGSWPAIEAIVAYRDRVRAALVAALSGPGPAPEVESVAAMVLEHELMHHETLLYMVQQLDRRLRRRPAHAPPYRFQGSAAPGTVSVPGGTVVLGERFDRVPFGWDNEFPEHAEEVAPFAVDRTPVRNGEWLEFVAAGGYTRPELWTESSWAWRERVGHTHPVFWTRAGGGRWTYQALADELPLEDVADWPVYVSWAEADAYARWRGASLPTEAEYHAAARAAGVRWGDPGGGNFDFAHWAPTPVGLYGGSGALDLVGNGWEWTRSRFGPFPGFEAWARTYAGYSADFFDEHHYVLLGASWATDRALVRRSFRNWFQPHYPYVFAKFRLVRPQ